MSLISALELTRLQEHLSECFENDVFVEDRFDRVLDTMAPPILEDAGVASDWKQDPGSLKKNFQVLTAYVTLKSKELVAASQKPDCSVGNGSVVVLTANSQGSAVSDPMVDQSNHPHGRIRAFK